jgi:hypothetical protein
MELDFTVNGYQFLISEAHQGYVWEHWDSARFDCVMADKGYFDTAAEAQRDALRHATELAEAEARAELQELIDEEEADEERRVGVHGLIE